MLKRTPLFEAHQQLGARLVEFGGWEMPVYYTSIVEEHLAVRRAAGIFDISHMGQITVSGAQATAFLNQVLTNDLCKLAPGWGQYTLLCNEQGGVIDDLYAYRLAEEVYLLIINAARTAVDVAWLQAQAAQFGAGNALHLTNAAHTYAAVAVQGPQVVQFIEACLPGASLSGARVDRVTALQKNQVGGFPYHNNSVLVARTGYTGEDGFEIIGPDESLRRLWSEVLTCGQAHGLQPCGLGARDTLRTEMGYPLYGHELDEQITPIEAGLGFFVALDKAAFNGRAVLAAQKADGVKQKCIAFKMTGKSAPPRPGYAIWANQQPVGRVTSGTQSPSLGLGIGLGYVPPEFAKPDTAIEIEIRSQRHNGVVVRKPIWRRTDTPAPATPRP